MSDNVNRVSPERGPPYTLGAQHDVPVRTPTLYGSSRFWARVAIAALATFLTGALCAVIVIRMRGWMHGLPTEVTFLQRMHMRLPSVLDWIVVSLPWLGTNLVFIPVLGPACWYLWRRRGRPDLALMIAVVTIGNNAIGTALKFAFERPRPRLWLARGEFSGPSYPSGHAMAIVGVIGFLVVLLHEERGLVWPYLAWLFLLVATCFSRLYLGVHWPTDLVGGLLTGGVWLTGMLWAHHTPWPSVPSPRRAPHSD